MPRHSAGRPASAVLRRVLVALLVTSLIALAWLAFRGYQVRGALLEARAGLTQAVSGAGSGRIDAFVLAQQQASADVRTARGAVQDPLWRLAAAVPLAGRSFATVRDSTAVVGQVVDEVLPPLLEGATDLQEGQLLADGQVDLPLLAALAEDVQTSEAAARDAERAATAISERYLPPPVADARGDLVSQVQQLADGLTTGREALALAPAMLGADGPRRYFLAVHNNAEVRGTGGLVGAYAVVRAERGRLSLDRVGTNGDFETAPAPVVDLGPEFSARYDSEFARSYWSAAVLTPDWPSAAQIMAGLWRQQGGGQLDGVLGVDPVAMADILAVTGPAQVGGRSIGTQNVVDFVMRDEYALFADENLERKRVLADLAEGVYTKVSAGGYSAPAMLSALGRAGGSGHLQVWSAQPAEQAVLAPLRASGALPGEPGSYLHVVSNNAAGNKADYYVRRRVSYVRTAPGEATATVELTNTVDAQAVPPIVIGRLDEPAFPVEPGQTRQLVSVYVGAGQQVRRMFVDGVEASADLGTERGHGVGTVLVEIRPSRPTVITAEVTDPGGLLTYRQQPLVVDDELALEVPYVVD
ncbi:MAG: DUF4012 domain-containing protein [Actinobacteria bacterium]|nr:DUF4012 domain-containing protein [Actinomycetota bacterium]